MIKEVIHPHNEALQLIDKKIKILSDTVDYIASDSVIGSFGSAVFQKQYNEAIDRLKQLERTKKLLMKLDGGGVDEVLYKEDGGKNKKHNTGRPVAIVSDDGKILREFKSIAQAERETDINRSTISYLINRGKNAKAAVKFIFLEKNENQVE